MNLKRIKIMLVVALIIFVPIKVEAKTFTANYLYHYGANCKKCSGITASGWNVKKKGIYYKDKTYGKIRICATSKKIKMYSVLEIPKYKGGSIKCIVLDHGVSGTNIDLLTTSEKKANKLGIQKNVKINILRWGK